MSRYIEDDFEFDDEIEKMIEEEYINDLVREFEEDNPYEEYEEEFGGETFQKLKKQSKPKTKGEKKRNKELRRERQCPRGKQWDGE